MTQQPLRQQNRPARMAVPVWPAARPCQSHLSGAGERLARDARLLLAALSIGLLAALLSYARLAINDIAAADFTWSLGGAARLWSGLNPYQDPALQPANPYPYNDRLLYPLPALLVATPFTLLPPTLAGALFVGLSVGLLSFGIGRDGWRLWPMLLSAPLWAAVFTVQWSPLLVSAALLPALLPLTLAKPNVGLPILLAAPTSRRLLAAAAVLLASLLLLPAWPWDWLQNASQHNVFIPLLVAPGALLVLAVWRWRDRSTRQLLLLALLPQRAIYDQLGIWLVARSWKQALLLSIGSWISLIGWWQGPASAPTWIVLWMYIPALLVCLWTAPGPLARPLGSRPAGTRGGSQPAGEGG